ncbi:DNA-binding protein, partial [Streptomyces clavuligerus]
PPTVAALTARIRHAWLVWHGIGHHRSSVAELLPALLADAQHAARALDGADRRKALALLAQAYHLTQLYLSFQPTPELVILAGDRAMAAAQDADDPRAIAAAAWYMGHIHRDSGEAAAARVDLALQAASLLRPEAHQEDLALHGLLHLAVALSHAKTAGAGKAEHHWDIADRAASALGESYAHPWLVFGRGVVDGYALTIRTDLVQTRAAVRIAADLRTQTVPSATRRAYHVIEQARAYSLAGEPIATVHFLSQAQRISPETTSFNLFARSAVSDLASFGPAAIRPQATALAREWGVDAA